MASLLGTGASWSKTWDMRMLAFVMRAARGPSDMRALLRQPEVSEAEPEEPLYDLEPSVLGAAPDLSFMSLAGS